jgi:hypothetical protein
MISRVHIEDANELTGSSLRYLLFYSGGSLSAQKETPSTSGKMTQSMSNRTCFVLKLCNDTTKIRRELRLDLSLQRMENHCHPNVIKALYAFIVAVTDSKNSKKSVGKHVRPDSFEKSPDKHTESSRQLNSSRRSPVDGEHDSSLVVGIKLKDVAFHLYDPGGLIGILVLADSTSSLSFQASRQDMMKVVVSIREVRIKGPRWASGNVGGDVFGHSSHGPAANLNLTITKIWKRNSCTGLQYSVVDIEASLQNAWWILLNDYLALLIGYIVSSEWKTSGCKDHLRKPDELANASVTAESGRNVVLFKIEVSDSSVLFASEYCLLSRSTWSSIFLNF